MRSHNCILITWFKPNVNETHKVHGLTLLSLYSHIIWNIYLAYLICSKYNEEWPTNYKYIHKYNINMTDICNYDLIILTNLSISISTANNVQLVQPDQTTSLIQEQTKCAKWKRSFGHTCMIKELHCLLFCKVGSHWLISSQGSSVA